MTAKDSIDTWFAKRRAGVITAALVAALAIAQTPRATAEPRIATGEIVAIDIDKRTIALSTGQHFRAGEKVKLSKRTPGEKVLIIYEASDGDLTATKIRRIPAALESLVSPPDRKPRPGLEAEVDD